MSSCNDFAEFACHLALGTGAPPHLVMPLTRRLRRLATTHARRCETQCNGCHQCGGAGAFALLHDVLCTRIRDAREALAARGCSGPPFMVHTGGCGECASCKAANASETCDCALGGPKWHPSEGGARPCPQCSTDTVERAIEATCEELNKLAHEFDWGRDSEEDDFVPTFQHDPRGATVRLRVPSGASDSYGGVVVPIGRV